MDRALYMKNRRLNRRSEAIELLGGKCSKCGSSEHLEFDHIDPKTKTMNISSPKCLDGPYELFLEEVKKCQLLCGEDHKEKSRSNNDYKGGHNKIVNPSHGSGPVYASGCRCQECVNWKSLYREKKISYSGIL